MDSENLSTKNSYLVIGSIFVALIGVSAFTLTNGGNNPETSEEPFCQQIGTPNVDITCSNTNSQTVSATLSCNITVLGSSDTQYKVEFRGRTVSEQTISAGETFSMSAVDPERLSVTPESPRGSSCTGKQAVITDFSEYTD